MRTLLEYQQKDLKQKFGQELAARFLEMRKKLPPPQNQIDYWMKKESDELRDYLDNYKSKTQKDKEEKIAGTEVIYDDENWKVIHLLTYEAAKHYGGDSTWCITGRWPNAPEKGEYYFNSYLRDQYSGYYLYINKHMTDPRKDQKYMVCPKQREASECDIYDQEHNPSTIPFIPNCNIHIEGFPSVGQFTIVDGKLISARSGGYSTGIVIPEGVDTIKHKLFLGESSIQEIVLPNSLKTIETGAFAQTGISKLDLKNTENIGVGIVMACTYLREITLREVSSIPRKCFAHCNNLSNVWIYGNITSIDETAFDGTNKNVQIWCDTDTNKLLVDYGTRHNIDVVNKKTGEIVNANNIDYDNR